MPGKALCLQVLPPPPISLTKLRRLIAERIEPICPVDWSEFRRPPPTTLLTQVSRVEPSLNSAMSDERFSIGWQILALI